MHPPLCRPGAPACPPWGAWLLGRWRGGPAPAASSLVPPPQVTQYLLDQSSVMDEESLYESSLRIEPKLPT